MKIRQILNAIEAFAPRALQEGYDNAGIQAGDAANDCRGVLLALDVTERTVDEAIKRNCNLIISHHPLLFKGIKSITPENATGRMIIKALAGGITVYAAHTNLDNATGGVSWRMADMLGLKNVEVLAPQKGTLSKLAVFVPGDYAGAVSEALFAAGAGNIGNYDRCCYSLEGRGSFRPGREANPFVGTAGETHYCNEQKIEVIIPTWRAEKAIKAMIAVHPYEEPAYDLIPLANTDLHSGCGAVGDIEPVALGDFLQCLKVKFGTKAVRYCGDLSVEIRRVAVCGGSGASMTGDAIAAGADIYVSGDFKYHDFTTYGEKIILADIGHYESEQCAKGIFAGIIEKQFPGLPVCFAETDTNPINYI